VVSFSVTRIPESQIVLAGRLLIKAFFDDPFFTYIFPDPNAHIEALDFYFQASIRAGRLFEAVYTTSGVPYGVAVWGTPSQALTPEQTAQAGLNRFPALFGEAAYQRYQRMCDYLMALRNRDMPSLHWYLSILGVDPEHQGKGIGHVLMQPVLTQADATGVPCYLETFKDDNLAFYRRCGFAILFTGVEPDSRLPFWTLRRTPQRLKGDKHD